MLACDQTCACRRWRAWRASPGRGPSARPTTRTSPSSGRRAWGAAGAAGPVWGDVQVAAGAAAQPRRRTQVAPAAQCPLGRLPVPAAPAQLLSSSLALTGGWKHRPLFRSGGATRSPRTEAQVVPHMLRALMRAMLSRALAAGRGALSTRPGRGGRRSRRRTMYAWRTPPPARPPSCARRRCRRRRPATRARRRWQTRRALRRPAAPQRPARPRPPAAAAAPAARPSSHGSAPAACTERRWRRQALRPRAARRRTWCEAGVEWDRAPGVRCRCAFVWAAQSRRRPWLPSLRKRASAHTFAAVSSGCPARACPTRGALPSLRGRCEACPGRCQSARYGMVHAMLSNSLTKGRWWTDQLHS
jgi:hypothetical protein